MILLSRLEIWSIEVSASGRTTGETLHTDAGSQGTDTIALYRLFQSLRGQARAAGGDLYSILGSE